MMYDPLHDSCPGPQQPPAPSYWQDHSHTSWPATAGPLPNYADVVIIGGGYTGLNAALELAERYQQQVVVLEANQLGWGCSSRNAGFAMPGTGRLGYATWAKRFGENTARGIQAEYQQAFARLARHQAACPEQLQTQPGGYLKIAHTVKAVAELQQQYQQLQRFEPGTRWLNKAQLQDEINSPHAHAAIHFPQSFGLNPLLLAASVARQADQAGAQLCSHTPVQHWHTDPQQQHHLSTPAGTIRCAKVIIASNGYSAQNLHPSVQGRTLPVLSSVVVTRPLTPTELATIKLTSQRLVMDTRALKYYFRLLPDQRLLFGGRGAITGKDADKPRYREHLLAALADTFSCLRGIQAEYFWNGWVSVALDDYPRIYSPSPGVFTSMGYCGAGVTFTQLAGQRVAQLAMGAELPALPFYQSALPRFPFARFRRLGQRFYYYVHR